MDMLSAILHRRSIRRYTGESVPAEKLRAVLCAGLSAASSKNRRPWEFIVIENQETLARLGGCRPGAASLLEGCGAAIVVAADSNLVDVWVEDCASAMTQMHLMADASGLGSCWLQIRLRRTPDGAQESQAFVRALLGIPEKYSVMALLVLGMPTEHPAPRTTADLLLDKVHYEHFQQGAAANEDHVCPPC